MSKRRRKRNFARLPSFFKLYPPPLLLPISIPPLLSPPNPLAPTLTPPSLPQRRRRRKRKRNERSGGRGREEEKEGGAQCPSEIIHQAPPQTPLLFLHASPPQPLTRLRKAVLRWGRGRKDWRRACRSGGRRPSEKGGKRNGKRTRHGGSGPSNTLLQHQLFILH